MARKRKISYKKRMQVYVILILWEMFFILLINPRCILYCLVLAFIIAIIQTRKKIIKYNRRRRAKKAKVNINSLKIKEPAYKTQSETKQKVKHEYDFNQLYLQSITGQPIKLDDVNDITGEEFETLIFNRFHSLGYTVYYTTTSHDYGADLLLTVDGVEYAIQVKRYNHKKGRTVGIDAVQQIIGAMYYYKCNSGVVITNSTFTQSAKDLASYAGNVLLWDRESLKKHLYFI